MAVLKFLSKKKNNFIIIQETQSFFREETYIFGFSTRYRKYLLPMIFTMISGIGSDLWGLFEAEDMVSLSPNLSRSLGVKNK